MNRLVLLALLAAVLPASSFSQEGGAFRFEGKVIEVSQAEIAEELAHLARLSPGNRGARQIEQAWARVIRRKAAQHLGLKLSPERFAQMMEQRHRDLRMAWMVDGKVDRDRLARYLSSFGFNNLQSYEDFCRDEFLMELFLEREFPIQPPIAGAAWSRFQADRAILKVRALVFSEENSPDALPIDFDNPETREKFFNWWRSLPESIRLPFDDGSRPAIETEALSVVFSRFTPATFKTFFELPREVLGGESFADRTANIVISPRHATKIRQRWERYSRTAYSAVLRTLPRGLNARDEFDAIRPHLEREYRMIRYLESIWLKLGDSENIDLKVVGAAADIEWKHLPFDRINKHVNENEIYGDHPIHMWKLKPGLFDNITDPNNMGHCRYAQGVVDQPGGHASIFIIRRAEGMRLLSPTEAIKVTRAKDDFTRIYAWNEVQKTLGTFGRQLREVTQSKLPKTDIAFKDVLQARGAALRSMKGKITSAQWMGPFFVRAADNNKPDAVRTGPLGPRVANALQRSIRSMLPAGTMPQVGDVLLPTSCNNQRVGLAAEILGIKLPSRAQFNMAHSGRSATEATLSLEHRRARARRIQMAYAWPNIVKKFRIVAPDFDRIMAQGLAPAPTKEPVSTPPTRSETLRARLAAGRYKSLNPVTYRGQGAYNVLRFLLNPYLLQVDPDTLQLLPYLAESLPAISDDGLIHTWTLRDAKWSDGERVTSDDIVFTWNMIQHERVPAPQVAGAIGDVTHIRKLDHRRFTVHYKKRYFRATASFGLLFGVTPAHCSPTDPDEFARAPQLIGCGPYRIKRWDQKELVLDRVNNWWGQSIPRFKKCFRIRRIVHRFIEDSLQLSLQLKSGEIDLAALGGTDDFIRWKKNTEGDSRFDSASYYLPGWSYIGWNCEDPLFTDRKVRRALAYLAPRQQVNQSSHGGLALLTAGPYPKGSPFADSTIKPLLFSYRRAEALLKEAGWTDSNSDGVLDKDGRDFKFELLRPKGDASWMRIINVYRQRLEQVGIQMTIRQVDFTTILNLGPKHDFQAYVLIWRVDAVDPDIYDLFHSSQTADGNNWQNFKNSAIDKLLEEFQSTNNPGRRAVLGHSIHQSIISEQPVCFLFSSPSCVVWNRRVKDVRVHRLGLREWDMVLSEEK